MSPESRLPPMGAGVPIRRSVDLAIRHFALPIVVAPSLDGSGTFSSQQLKGTAADQLSQAERLDGAQGEPELDKAAATSPENDER